MRLPSTRIFCALLPFVCAFAFAQNTTLQNETSNTTSACSASTAPAYCSAAFTPMGDSTGIFNSAPGNISTEDVHELLYPGDTTLMFTHFQPWFCMGSSPLTGTGSSCGSHIQVGYNSNDPNTVHGQVNDMLQRGFNGTVIDYYGPNHITEDGTTALFSSDLDARCSGAQNCPFYYALMYDQGAFQYVCPSNGTDQTQCILSTMQSDFDYMNSHYFGSLSYLRVDSSNHPSAAGSPVVMFFVCETCFTNPAPNWNLIWSSLQQYTAAYGNNSPQIYFYRNSGGFTHAETNGAFAWVNWWGSADTYGLTYLDQFYNSAVANSSKITFGAQWKGFDNTDAPWGVTPRNTPQQCGNTWLQTFQQATYKNDFGSTRQLPFSGVVTWNDYEEGSEVETGIDNCLSLSASVTATTLSWIPSFSDPSGSENTVHHYLVFDSLDGVNLATLANVSAGTHSLDLSQFALVPGTHTLYVKAVGQPSILNKMSTPATYIVTAVGVQSVSVNPSAVTGGASTSGTVTLTNSAPAGGFVVSLASNAGAAMPPAQVTVAAGTSTARFSIATTAVSYTTSAGITAQSGTSGATATLSITPAALSSVALSPTSIGGSANTLLTVQLSGPSSSTGALVALTSSNSYVTVPATITVPAGASSVTATLTTRTVTAATKTTVTAKYLGKSASAGVTLYATPSSLSSSSSSVIGGKTLKGTLSLTGAAPSGGQLVQLKSNSSYALVPSSVTVAAGSKSVTFAITTKSTSSTHTAMISATAWGVSKTVSFSVKP